ncbi:tyrosine-protein kinase Tec-like [Ptychodera flava]|uniref:tyrosine-protein kinase Tec-like n=1 Tax=Ptychodera flava TaxID=63121 RepID=UPI00396A12F7
MAAANMEGGRSIIKKAYMIKRSVNKKRMGPSNYKGRVFLLTRDALSYHDGDLDKWGKEKGRISLKEIRAVEAVDDDAFYDMKPSSKGYPFQICWEEYTLYIFSQSMDERNDWVATLQDMCKENDSLLDRYHSGFFTSSKWTCCEQEARQAPGCKNAFIHRHHNHGPPSHNRPDGRIRSTLPPIPTEPVNIRTTHQPPKDQLPPQPPPRPPEKELRVVIALYPYTPAQAGDLQLEKGEEYSIIDESREHWWKARNQRGQEGFIPSNFVKEKTEFTNSLEKYDWYSSTVSRTQAEEDLNNEDKEGCFIVRNSSTQGMYTLSVFSKDGPRGEGMTRHYHIKKNSQNLYYMSEKHAYPTIPELIEYHQHNSGGLATRLRKPPKSYSSVPATAGLGHDIFEIDPTEITLMKELGGGQFGVVRLGKLKNGLLVAVKMMRENAMSEDDFIDEAKVMQELSHDHLVQLYGVCSKQRPLYIVTEYMNKGCLLNFLRYRQYLLDKPLQLIDMCKQVCSAMTYLEHKNFIHRDLAARNCLVGERMIVKVADFGLTRYVIDDEYTSSGGSKFPIKWAPPEVLHYTRFSSKSDVWAFGILMWEVFTAGKMPYPSMSNVEVVTQVTHRGYRLEKPNACPQNVYQIMSECWKEKPEQRPPFRRLHKKLEHLLSEDYSDHQLDAFA